VFAAATPAALTRAGVLTPPVELATLLYGISVVAAAFAMSWAAEAAEHDVPRALSLIIVAFIAVLPEYAVDIVFAWKAGQDPAFAPYAAANMTGSNRLLLGLGWSTVAVIAWVKGRHALIRLDRGDAVAVVFLGIATLYSFSLPFRAEISLVDTAILVTLFGVYAIWAARSGLEEPDLVGPAAVIGALPPLGRRLVVAMLFAFAGAAIVTAAEPFADGLVRTGRSLGIDEFLLVQWLAPLASESPEFLVAALLAWRGRATVALALLLSAKINQWTLLVGSLALSYSIGAGAPSALPLDARQSAEVLLTATQSLFGVAVLASLTFSVTEAGMLAGLFAAQLVIGGVLRAALQDPATADAELAAFSALYVALAAWQLVRARHLLAGVARRMRAGFARGS
jgi:cation:H+ antiporter